MNEFMEVPTMFNKFNTLCVKAKIKMDAARDRMVNDIAGSDTTEKIGMVVVAIVIVGLLAAAVKTAMPGLFDSIIAKAREKLEGIF